MIEIHKKPGVKIVAVVLLLIFAHEQIGWVQEGKPVWTNHSYKENPDYETEAYLIAQMSFFRNRLGYYGESIPMSFYDKNKEEFKKAIKLILNLIGGE